MYDITGYFSMHIAPHIQSYAIYRWPARSIVQSSLVNRYNIHSSGKIAVLDHFCPWKEHLFEIEKEVSFALISAYFSLKLRLIYGLIYTAY